MILLPIKHNHVLSPIPDRLPLPSTPMMPQVQVTAKPRPIAALLSDERKP